MAPEIASPLLAGRVAVVVGRTGGLGLAVARGLAEAGAQVVLAGPDQAAGAEAAAQLAHDGCAARFEWLPALAPVPINTLAARVVEAHGRLDVWVNAPVVNAEAPAEALPPEAWAQCLAETVSAAFYGAQAAGRHMLAQGGGVILNVSGVAGYLSRAGGVAASVAEAGLLKLTHSLGVEWAARGVRVVGLAAGPAEAAGPLRRIPLRRPVEPREVAAAAVYLVSEAASYIVGETLPVDGGWRAYQLF